MQSKSMILARPFALVIGAALIMGVPAEAARPKAKVHRAKVTKPRAERRLPAGIQRPTGEMVLSEGRGQLITLPAPITDIFVSNESVADVQVRSPLQLYVFAKGKGETSIYATNKSGAVVYSSNVRVGTNLNSLDQMLKLAMPEADIKATTMNGLVLLTGTVISPDDAVEAEKLVTAYVGAGVQVVSRLKTATPLQVNVQVRIAEVSRSFSKNIGANLTTLDGTDGFQFGIGGGRPITSQFNALGGPLGIGSTASRCLPPISATGQCAGTIAGTAITPGSERTTIGLMGKLLGLNVLGALDLGETEGFVTTLASPNLTALSGETATFLAGGEIPIPIAQGLGSVSVEFKSYGVNLAFTPTVMSDGRISLRIKPEVSDLDYQNAITFQGTTVPGISTRRAETTVELGSGQSFVIGGLLKASNANTMQKTPGVGDVPVLGALFRSNSFRRGETELMIVVTPYLVNPVAANQIILPTDGYKAPGDLARVFGGQLYQGTTGEKRPAPTVAPPTTVPGGAVGSRPRNGAAPAPGFSN
jgi:pilus assembly protein CpaC